MNSTREEKLSRSALVDFLWRSENLTDGVYVASADVSWDMIFTRTRAGQPKVLLCGASYKNCASPLLFGGEAYWYLFQTLGGVYWYSDDNLAP